MRKFLLNSIEIAAGILVAHVIVEKWGTIKHFTDVFIGYIK